MSENVTPAEVADEIIALACLATEPLTVNLEAPSGYSTIAIAPGIVRELGMRMRQSCAGDQASVDRHGRKRQRAAPLGSPGGPRFSGHRT